MSLKDEILLLKQQMYSLEDEAERLEHKSRTYCRLNDFSKVKSFNYDINLEKEARQKRLEARLIKHKLIELQSKKETRD